MKKVEKTLLMFCSILFIVLCVAMSFSISALAYESSDVTTENIQSLIDALPDASTVTLGDEPCRSDVIEIFRMLYELAGNSSNTLPDLTKLLDVSTVVLNVAERSWCLAAVGPTLDSSYYSFSSNRIRDWLRSKNNTQALKWKEYVKQIYRDALKDASHRPTSNSFNRLLGQFNNQYYATAQDFLDCMIPESIEAINALTQSDIKWIRSLTWNDLCVPAKIWSLIDSETRSNNSAESLNAMNLDVTLLSALSKKVLTLSERAKSLPHMYAWQAIKSAGQLNDERVALIHDDVVYLYDCIFGKVQLPEGETIPDLGLYPTSAEYSVNLISSASYVLTYEERIAYLPTPEEYENMTTAQKHMVTNELDSLISYVYYRLPAEDLPDVSKLQALVPVAFDLETRCRHLPDKNKVDSYSSEMQEYVRNEVLTLYGMIEDLSETDTYPTADARPALRNVASVSLTLQERIDSLPSSDDLESSTNSKYVDFIFEEATVLREIINGLGAGATLPDDTKLSEVEHYFSSDVVEIWNENDFNTLFNTMNQSEDSLVVNAILMDDIITRTTFTDLPDDYVQLKNDKGGNINYYNL